MTLGDRIKKVRKVKDLTQQVFSERIGTTANVLTNYETGRRNPSNSVINNICKTFDVNEHWLRTGQGDMFVERSRDEELSAFVDDLLSKEPADFRRRLVTALSRLTPEQWDALEAVALSLLEKPDPDGSAQTTKFYIAARDGSRMEVEVDGEITIPEEDADIPK